MQTIDYDLTTIQGLVLDVDGVLSPSTIPLGQDGDPARMVNIKDGYALQHAIKKQMKILILSGAKSQAIEIRFSRLGINDIIMGASVKLPYLANWLKGSNLNAHHVAYIGDDIPDMHSMQAVGLAIAPSDAAPEIKAIAKYVSPYKGGYGVVRDALEQILKAQNKWLDDDVAFGW